MPHLSQGCAKLVMLNISHVIKMISNSTSAGESIEELTKEVEMLKLKLEEERAKFNDVELHVVAQKLETINNFLLKPRRVLKGHQGKVLALDWSSDKRHIASTSQVYSN